MAKITAYIPEPTPIFTPDNQRQIIQALTTIKDQLNTSFQQDLRNEQLAFTQFLYGTPGSLCSTGTSSNPVVIVPGGNSVDAFGTVSYTHLTLPTKA